MVGFGLIAILSSSLLLATADEYSHRYAPGDTLSVWADRTGPYDAPRETYSFEDLPLCDLWGLHELKRKSLSLGEAVQGKRTTLSPRIAIQWPEANDTKEAEPTEICRMRLTKELVQTLTQLISESYWASYEIDGLPTYAFLGEIKNDVPTIFAHRNFIIDRNGDQVIAVGVIPSAAVPLKENGELRLTYSARFVSTETPFSKRMSLFYETSFFEWKIQWFSVATSCLLTMMLVVLVASILRRAIKADLSTEIDETRAFDRFDEAGWKIISKEIFRKPKRLRIHSVIVGTGTHLIMAMLLGATMSLFRSALGYVAATAEFCIVIYTLTQPINGLATSYFYSQGNGHHWVSACAWSLLSFPLCCLLLFLQLNTAYTAYGTSTALTLGRVLGSVCLFTVVNLPLHAVGCHFGRILSLRVKAPIKANTLERPIPVKPWWLRTGVAILAGAMPFGCLFVETFFVFDAMWSHRAYFVYGFLLLVLGLYILSVACATITAVYLMLNSEDYRWQWFSIQCGATPALYLLVYAAVFHNKMVPTTSFLHNFSYWACTVIASLGWAAASGAVGHLAACFFVHRIYRSVKSE